MVFIAVKAVPTISNPSVTVGVRISTVDRYVSGAASPLSTKTSSLPGRVGGSAVMPELVKLVGRASTFFAEQNLTVLY